MARIKIPIGAGAAGELLKVVKKMHQQIDLRLDALEKALHKAATAKGKATSTSKRKGR